MGWCRGSFLPEGMLAMFEFNAADFEVRIEEHRDWNTKKMYYRGRLLPGAIYRRVPKAIRFKSPLVNDVNQLVCGGWGVVPNMRVVYEQLLSGRKPFGETGGWEDDKALEARLHSAGFLTKLSRRGEGDGFELLACRPMPVNEIGDMGDLYRDYYDALSEDMPDALDSLLKEMEKYQKWTLDKFFSGWDTPPLPRWLTGLILGYPVENTISIYRQG